VITDAQLRVSEVNPFGDNDTSSDDHISTGTNPFSDRERFSSPSFLSADQRTPGKPTGVTVVAGGTTDSDKQTSLAISWTPQKDGNKAITGVTVQVYDERLDIWALALNNISNNIPTSYTQRNLKPGSTHRYRVRNRDADGWGDWSDEVSGTTDAANH